MLFSAVDDYVWNRTMCTYNPSDCIDEHILYCIVLVGCLLRVRGKL
jgi:hypothetical protein